MKKCIFVFLASFVLLCCSVIPVQAYTAVDGYPFKIDYEYGEELRIYTGDNYTALTSYTYNEDTNIYTFNNSSNISNVSKITFGNPSNTNIFPIDLVNYDYYVVGTYAFNSSSLVNNDVIGITPINAQFTNTQVSVGIDMEYMMFRAYDRIRGQSFYGKILFDGSKTDNANLSCMLFDFSHTNQLFVSGNMEFSASIVPIKKDSGETEVLNSVLQKLNEINNNLISTNEILTQHDSNVSKWFQELITRMGIGFNALYQQMTKEQDEKLNGYDGSVASGAKDEFDSGASDLTAIEGTLNSSSTTLVNDFTSTGFDSGILTTLGASLTFVVTWFTNFWNMGGIWTVGLSTCFAIWIAFYILRTRSK